MTESKDEMETKENKIWNPFFIQIFATNGLMYLGLQMVQSLVGKYASTLGASAVVVGMVSSIFAVTCLLFKLFAGPSIDAFDRKYVLLAALSVIAVAFLGMSISKNVEMIVGFRLLQGAGQAFTATCCLALASDALPKKRFAAGIGTFTLAQAVCQAIGPSMGLWVARNFGYRVTFLTAGGCMMAAAASTLFIKTSFVKRKKFQLTFRNTIATEAFLPTFMLFLLSAAYHTIQSFLIIFAGERGVEEIGCFFTVYAIALLGTRPLFGRIMDKIGFVKAIIPALCCFALSFFLISISGSLGMFLLAALVSAFGYGVAAPAIHTLCMQTVPRERRGAASSTSYIGSDVGNLAGPTFAGAMAESFGYGAMWRIMIIPIFATLLLVVVFRRKIGNIEAAFRENSGDEEGKV